MVLYKYMIKKWFSLKFYWNKYPTMTRYLRGFGVIKEHFGTKYTYRGRHIQGYFFVPYKRYINIPAIILLSLLIFACFWAFVLKHNITIKNRAIDAMIEDLSLADEQIGEMYSRYKWIQKNDDYQFWSEDDIRLEIIKTANLHGIDANEALRIAECESGLNPQAKNYNSTAKGLYQFLDSTWQYIGSPGDRFNVRDNINAFMVYYPKNPKWWEECNK